METSVSAHFTGFSGGMLMSLIAFSIVFLVCIGLMLMMMALKHFSAYVDQATAKKEAKAAVAVAVPVPAPVAAETHVSAVAAADEDDEGEIVAVITAAILASCGAGAKILSIKPASPRAAASAWRMTGILQNTEGLSESF